LVPSVRFGANNSTDSFFDFTVVNAGGTVALDFRFYFMKRWIFVLFLCVAHSTVLRGEPFERAEVTKAVNLVSLLPQATRAVPGDVIKGDSALKTGGDSRAELQFPDLTIARVGSNALFRFIAGARDITLDGGTMLFSSPKGAGGGTVQAGAISAAVTGSDFLISNIGGRVKVISLSHKVLVYFTANPKIRAVLRPGEMVDIAGGATKMPSVTTINLAVLLSTSMLGDAGGLGPFPNQALLVRNQTGFVAANGNRPGANDPVPGAANLATQAAQTARSSTVTNNNSPAPPPRQPQVTPLPLTSPPTAPGSGGTVGNSGPGATGGNSGVAGLAARSGIADLA
jgi:hypothetical protein